MLITTEKIKLSVYRSSSSRREEQKRSSDAPDDAFFSFRGICFTCPSAKEPVESICKEETVEKMRKVIGQI